MARRFCSFIAGIALSAIIVSAANPPWGGTALVEPGSTDAQRFSGVGKISNCTVFLIKPSGAGPSSPAYVMTAGHCIDLGANDVILDRADTTRTVQFGLLKNAAPPLQIRSRRVVYSTMKEFDLALIELDTTLGAIESSGVVPLVLSRTLPSSTALVEWAGVPTGNVPTDERFLRTGPCEVSGVADVLEWRWLWRGQIRHDCSDISSGASGSPLIDRANGMVTGVIGTTNVGNSEPDSDGLCGRNDPCELQGASSVWVRGSSYATPVAHAASCFDATGALQLAAPGCGLDPGTQARVLESRLSVRPGSSWNTTVTHDSLRSFRYKIFVQGTGDCREETGYSQPESLPGRLSNPVPLAEGRYFACIIAEGQLPRFASVVHLRVDGTPPSGPAQFDLSQNDRGFTFVPASSLTTGLIIKPDEADVSTCADVSTYRRIYPVPWFIPRASVKRFCLVAEDAAGNASAPTEIDLINPTIFPVGVLASAGYVHGRAAPGSWISIFGLNLTSVDGTGTRALLRTGGSEIELPISYAADGQINARLPDSIPPGPATVIVAPPGRKPSSAPLLIEPAVPGIFTANGRANSFGVIYGIAGDGTRHPTMTCTTNACSPTPIDGLRDFAIFIGGLPGVRPVTATFSEQPVEVREVIPAVYPGVDEIRVHMPDGLNLRGYIPVRVTAARSESGPAWVWLR